MKIMIALCTCPDAAVAERIAMTLVEETLAACVNRVPAVTSTYRWQGKICHDDEHLLLIKTTHERFAAVRDRILALHPHELPEIVGLDVTAGFAPYLAWVEAQTRIEDASSGEH